MIRIDDVRVTYPEARDPALVVPGLHIEEGELVLVTGPTGGGKSTLLGTLNGLVPHFTGGTLAGRVVIAGRDTRRQRPRDLADVVGMVRQDPAATFVTDTVEEEIAYGMETLGVPHGVMRRRVEESLDLLGIAALRRRRLTQLTGGQQQRVAIAAVLAAGPAVLVLDEPTSALDPVAAEEVLSALHRLVHDLGLTVVLAEHRLERVIHHADRIVLVEGGRAEPALPPADAMARSPVYPPVVALGRLAGWDPLPLSVRDARRAAAELRADLAPLAPQPRGIPTSPRGGDPDGRHGGVQGARPGTSGRGTMPDAARTEGVDVRFGRRRALDQLSLRLHSGQVVALMGRNGSGKSTLMWTLSGVVRPAGGSVQVAGQDPAALSPARRAGLVGMVPQQPDRLLYAESVARECADADAEAGAASGTAAALAERIAGPLDPARHPRDLSEGQRLALALSVVLCRDPGMVLLDEPTRGLDYGAKHHLATIVAGIAAAGRSVLVATHDVEFAAEVADRVVLLSDGQVVADDPPDVLARSTAYAPQVARVLHPVPLLTVDAVRRSLLGRAS